jgi:hypothetical protein
MFVKDAKKALTDLNTSSEEDEGSANGDDDTLFNLVRGASKKGAKKRRVNFIVTLAGGGQDYVPSRHLPS